MEEIYMKKFCTSCGESLDVNLKFCGKCGEKQPETAPQPQSQQEPDAQSAQPIVRHCTNCGNPLDDDSKFCIVCGEKQKEVSNAPAAAVIPAAPVPPPINPAIPANPVYPPVNPINPVKPKKKSKLPVILIIAGIVLVGLAVGGYFLVTTVLGLLGNVAKEDYYKLDNDEIPSVKFVLGEERKVISSSTSISGNSTTKTIKYEVYGDDQNKEMTKYLKYLREKDGFLLLTDVDFDGSKGSCVVGRNSADKGYEIQLQIEYDKNGYTISILKQKGEITPLPTLQNEDPTDEPAIPDPTDDPEEEPAIPDPTDDPEEEPYIPTITIDDPDDEYDNSPLYGVWRYVSDDEVSVCVFYADDTFKAEMYYYDGELITSISGKFNISGDEILMTDVRHSGSLQRENYTYDFEIYGDIMSIDGIEYERVPYEDTEAILANPFHGLSINDYPQDDPDDTIENVPYYELGRDLITSITRVVGERTFVYFYTETEDDYISVTVIYKTDPDDYTQAVSDIWEYFQYLTNNDGFYNLVAFDELPYAGGIEMRLAKNSLDAGNIIILEIEYNTNGYALTFTKGEGTLTINP
jgi:predicted nucleic acid-binding Zn ribbon protein